ncbi:hypothetical protein [Nostoc sp. UHCC 0252]|uniref:hypothetical protein n=1 Tax=Nostoc sp. UHCC 0252 TaxID=3110241 RepID=UPI002B203DE8|nr:hypothetical protein [Nostoc sp. UHCC 0252]MEA5603518.1 hypothetical protein [Nostoc sp. UHCC 0252]
MSISIKSKTDVKTLCIPRLSVFSARQSLMGETTPDEAAQRTGSPRRRGLVSVVRLFG